MPGNASGGSRRPGTKSLWLLPSGPDQVGDSAVRRLPGAHMGEVLVGRKFQGSIAFIEGSPGGVNGWRPFLEAVRMPVASLLVPLFLSAVQAASSPISVV